MSAAFAAPEAPNGSTGPAGSTGAPEPAGTDDPAAVLADAELAAFVEGVRREPERPWREQGAVEIRRGQRARAAVRPRGPEMEAVQDLTADGVPVRLYRPGPAAQGAPAGADGPRATVVYLHGGAWTTGDLESHDRVCRRLARAVGAAVLAVDREARVISVTVPEGLLDE